MIVGGGDGERMVREVVRGGCKGPPEKTMPITFLRFFVSHMIVPFISEGSVFTHQVPKVLLQKAGFQGVVTCYKPELLWICHKSAECCKTPD